MPCEACCPPKLEAELFEPSDFAPTLSFPGGDVPLPANEGVGAPATTREPELIRNVLVEVMSKLDALVDFTDSDGEWKDRVRLARRELGRANVAAAREPFESVPVRRRYWDQL